MLSTDNNEFNIAPLDLSMDESHILKIDPQATKSLFVGDLSFFCNEIDLYTLFAKYGAISSVEIKYGRMGDSMHHGFVEFYSLVSSYAAVRELNGEKFLGRIMRVNWTNTKIPHKPIESWTLVQVHFVSDNLSLKITEELLDSVFTPYGEILDVMVKRHDLCPTSRGQSQQLRGYGNVYFLHPMAAFTAVTSVKSMTQVLPDVQFTCSVILPKQKPSEFPRLQFTHLQNIHHPDTLRSHSSSVCASQWHSQMKPSSHPATSVSHRRITSLSSSSLHSNSSLSHVPSLTPLSQTFNAHRMCDNNGNLTHCDWSTGLTHNSLSLPPPHFSSLSIFPMEEDARYRENSIAARNYPAVGPRHPHAMEVFPSALGKTWKPPTLFEDANFNSIEPFMKAPKAVPTIDHQQSLLPSHWPQETTPANCNSPWPTPSFSQPYLASNHDHLHMINQNP